jgi:uncharacterized membrane protein
MGLAFVSGLLEVPPWYGISLGLLALFAAVAEMRGEKEKERSHKGAKRAAWVGLVGGAVASLIGITLYAAAWMWAAG